MAATAAVAGELARASRVLLLTGSGTSAESGVPTFRDAQTGLWSRYRAEDLATPEAFRRDPELVWGWYQWRRRLVSQALPNPGHRAIADLERLLPDVLVVTQNVDGLHQRAGSTRVVEFHGNLQRNRCATENRVIEIDAGKADKPPSCPDCGGAIRPDVVWFGENIPPSAMNSALAAAQACDVFLAIGTSAQVQPAAGLAEIAKARGAVLVEVNPNPTPVTALADHVLSAPSGVVLPRIVDEVRKLLVAA